MELLAQGAVVEESSLSARQEAGAGALVAMQPKLGGQQVEVVAEQQRRLGSGASQEWWGWSCDGRSGRGSGIDTGNIRRRTHMVRERRILRNVLRSKQLLSICADGDLASTQAHINWCCALPDREFALRITLLACDSWWKESVIVFEQINEEHWIVISAYSKNLQSKTYR